MADTNATAERVERKLDEQISKLQRQKKTSLAIGVILIVIVIIYMSWLGSQVSQVSDPEAIGDVAVGMAEERIPQLRQDLTTELQSNAEPMLNNIVDEGINTLPEIRRNIENRITDLVDEQLLETEAGLNEFLDYAYRNQGEQVRVIVDRLDAAETQEEIEQVLYELLRQPFDQPEFQLDLRTYDLALNNLADRLEYLRTADQLSEGEEIERDLIVVLHELSERSDLPTADQLQIVD